MHLLLTNDDGIDAAGLAALHESLRGEHTLSVVAPASEQSRTGHTASYDRPIRVHRRQHEQFGSCYAVEGTPVDCVRLALTTLITEPVDRVISGVNFGANVGWVDLATSGTFAAARDAVFTGVPAIAISQFFYFNQPNDWNATTLRARAILQELLADDAPPVRLWNVNLPRVESGQAPVGARMLPPSFDQIPLRYDLTEGVDGQTSYQYAGFWESRARTADHDVDGVFSGSIVLTPFEPSMRVAQDIVPAGFVESLDTLAKNLSA